MTARTQRPAAAVAAAAGAIAIWSLNAAAGGAALGELTVLQVLALQFGGAFAALAIVRALRRDDRAERPPPARARMVAIGVAGVTGTTVLQYVAFATAPLVAANAIAYSWPLLAAAWAALAPRGGGSRASLALAVVGFAGVVLLFASRGASSTAGGAPLLGYVAALASAVAMAVYTVFAGRSGARAGDVLLAATAVGAAGTIPAALLSGAPWSPAWAVALGLGIGVAMLALGYWLWTRAMAHPVGARLAPAAYAAPLLSTGILLATGQRLPALGLAGCGLVVVCAAGVILDARRRPALPRACARRYTARSRPIVAAVRSAPFATYEDRAGRGP